MKIITNDYNYYGIIANINNNLFLFHVTPLFSSSTNI